jgi:SMODS-associating 2TM, beta-strand rich effector domain
MRPSRVFIQAIVLVVAGVYLVAFLARGLPTTELFAPIGAASSVASLLVLAFDHFLWRLPRVGRKLSRRPDMRGTWRGRLASNWINPETGQRIEPDPEVYLVVRQTFWSVTANLITKESKSCSTTATIEDDGCGQYQFVAQYRNTPRASVRERSEVHHGSFKLDVGGEPVDRLEGYYWTDRNTMGELEFDRRSGKAVDSFTHAQALGL